MARLTANERVVMISEARDAVLDAFDDAIASTSVGPGGRDGRPIPEPVQYDLICDLIETLSMCKDEIEYKRESRRAKRTTVKKKRGHRG